MHGLPTADLIERHGWIVDHFCARYRSIGRGADLRAAGQHGLCEAAAKFEPTRGRAFSTYAWNWVKGCVLSEIRRGHVVPVPEHTARKAYAAGEPVRGVVVFGVPEQPQEDEQERLSDRSMRLRAVRQCVRELGDKLTRRVVLLLLEGDSIESIAKALDLTQTRVGELLESAERQLRELMG
jgi:RNA polymerase sigma factor (sigma-70 family)